MRNGYALCTAAGLAAIEEYLQAADEAQWEGLRSLLRIGLHWAVEVTDAPGPTRPEVSQAFCASSRAGGWEVLGGLLIESVHA